MMSDDVGGLSDSVFKQMLEHLVSPVSLFSRDMRFVYANKASQALVQKKWAEMSGRRLFDVFPDTPEREAAVQAKFDGCFAGEVTHMDALPYEIELNGVRQIRYWQAVQQPFRDGEGNVTHVLQSIDDVTNQFEARRQRDAISKELDHRVKNLISVISATAMISGQSATSVPQFVEDFGTRLRAMDRTYSRLNDTDWKGRDLHELFMEEVCQFKTARKSIDIEGGPDILMSVQGTKDAAMMIHEVATNAAKYGCFSVPNGTLKIRWELHEDHMLVFWEESGLTDLKTPERIGFGTQLFDMMPYMEMQRDYRPTGLHIIAKVYGSVKDGQFWMRAES